MGTVLTGIALLGGKALANALSTYAFDYLCENPNAVNFLSNCAAGIIDKGAEVIETDKKDKEKLFQTFQSLLYQLIREAIIETKVPEDMQEWIDKDLLYVLNKIEIPSEKCLGDGLGDFLCEEYYKVTSVSKNEVIDHVLVAYAAKYKKLFWDIYSNEAEMRAAVDRKFAAHDIELAEHRDTLANHEGRISVLETSFENQRRIENPEYIELYYKSLIEEFEKEEESFLGHKSLRDTYIPPRIKGGGDMKLEVYKWFRSTEYGVLLLYGHPGHGKTSFCKKFVYDYAFKNPKRATDAEVLQFPLNQAHSQIIVADNMENSLHLENCFNDGRRDGSKLLSWEECRRKLIFLDGFDELLNMLTKETDINSYREFAEFVEGIAEKYKIHFVVTSRINAVTPDDCNQPNAYEFAELSFEEQRAWCLVHKPDYWNNYLHGICESTDLSSVNDNLNVLLKIPYIFRMVAEHEYVMTGTVKNRAALFADLFSQTMGRTKRHRKEKAFFNPNVLNSSFQGLAYDIWCDNCDSVERSEENKQLLLLTYYIKENDTKGRISFYHKSFYDYFLSLYFYNKLKESIKDESPDIFLEKLAERRLEPDILEFISELKVNDKDPIKEPGLDSSEEEVNDKDSKKKSGLAQVLDRIEKSECIGIDTKDRKEIKGNAETLKYERCNNIFVNSLNILFCFDIAKIFNKLVYTKRLMGKFSCSDLRLSFNSEKVDLSNCVFQRADFNGADFRRANLSGADLFGAYLSKADLFGADLSRADLKEADLSGADLSVANLFRADLKETDLSRADLFGADLKEADLRRADFRVADLREADLRRADLSVADLFRAKLSRADLSRADLKEADLSVADLNGAYLIEADLREADLRRADLSGADLSGADLSGADLSGADLSGAYLNGADLNEANFNGAKLRKEDYEQLISRGVDINGVCIIEYY